MKPLENSQLESRIPKTIISNAEIRSHAMALFFAMSIFSLYIFAVLSFSEISPCLRIVKQIRHTGYVLVFAFRNRYPDRVYRKLYISRNSLGFKVVLISVKGCLADKINVVYLGRIYGLGDRLAA